jgi:hypothetical protein
VRLGPFPTLEDAQAAAEHAVSAHQLSPTVFVENGERFE